MKPININKILIIQTAFIGDVVLATPVIEALKLNFPNSKIDFLLRSGNESLLQNHPKINSILIWNKKESKLRNQIKLICKIRHQNYDLVINLQRFLSSGIFTVFSKAKITIGFNKNPLSFMFTHTVKHEIKKGIHEIDRNNSLLKPLFIESNSKMKLYPSETDSEKVKKYKEQKYIVIAPMSVWFTKQYPNYKWVDFIKLLPEDYTIYFIGSKQDREIVEETIIKLSNKKCVNLCGDLTFLESTSLMQDATMNYVNDSAPMHLASSVNASVVAIFCSTITDFGFGPKSENSFVIETEEKLDCKPCGLHGKKTCPEGHFNCAKKIKTEHLLSLIK